MAAASLMASGAGAADPPIISLGPIGGGDTGVSATVGSDATADACVGDQHSGVDPSQISPVKLNDANCTTDASPSAGGTSSTGGGTQSTSGPRPADATTTSTAAGASMTFVSADSAVGLRIVRVRKQLAGVRTTERFRVLVTVRDANGRLVRGAIVSVGRIPGTQNTITGIQAAFSNKQGLARLVVPVTRKHFGKRLFLKVAARTPSARAIALRSVVLPRLR